MDSLYTCEQVRRIDQQTIDAGVSAYVLMQRAAAAAFRAIAGRWPQCEQLLIVCGAGNNAGDGYELGSQAQAAGWQVQIFYLKPPATLHGPAFTAANAALHNGVNCQPFSAESLSRYLKTEPVVHSVIVDAMLGIGFSGALNAVYADAVTVINGCGLPVFAIDVPTGVNADSGHVDPVAVCADATLSVIARKQGLYTGDAPAFTGDMLFDDLGIPVSVLQQAPATEPAARGLDASLLRQTRLARSRTAHKGDSGHVLVIGGDHGFGGAALMAAEAAARAGAGTVSLLTRSAHVSAMLARRPEVMVLGIDDMSADNTAQVLALMARASAIVLGPGLGRSSWSQTLVQTALAQAASRALPLVVDADALNLLAATDVRWLQLAADAVRAQWVITPHPGEAARLLSCTAAQVSADRFASVRALRDKTGTVCVLKGAGTLLAYPDLSRPLDICLAGNPGMASGGMGDVLAGVCGAMLALGHSLTARHSVNAFDASQAAALAVCVHALAADQAAAQIGERGLMATDLLPRLPQVLSRCADRRAD